MKFIHTGRAALLPYSFLPRETFVSYPIHTPVVYPGLNPMNQASVESSVVPVFPARSLRRRP